MNPQLRLVLCFSVALLVGLGSTENCGAGCKTCDTTGAVCTVCTNVDWYLNKPDDGTCVEKCDAPKTGFTLENGIKICSPYAAPISKMQADIVIDSTANNLVSLSNLCDASVQTVDARKNEKVGALVLINSKNGSLIGSGFNTTEFKEKLRQGPPAISDADFASKNNQFLTRFGFYEQYLVVNIIGTEQSNGNIQNLKVFKGVNTVEYFCLNQYNMKSNYSSFKIINNVTVNKAVRFRVVFNRELSLAEYDDLMCKVTDAIVGASGQMSWVYGSSKTLRCSKAARRYLAVASTHKRLLYSEIIGEQIFTVQANQLDDSWEQTVKAKEGDLSTIFKTFATSKSISVKKNIVTISFDPNAALKAPVLETSQNITNSILVLTVTSDVDSFLFWALYDIKDKNNISTFRRLSDVDSRVYPPYASDNILLKANTKTDITVYNTTQLNGDTYYLFYQGVNAIDTDSSNLQTLNYTTVVVQKASGNTGSWAIMNNTLLMLCLIMIIFFN